MITPVEASWIKENIKKIDFLSPLEPDQIDSLIEHLKPRLMNGSESIIKEGDKGENFFIIYNGRVTVRVSRDGESLKLATLKRGDCFGEISLLTGKPATANVTATAPTKVFFLDSKHFLSLVRSNPELSKQIITIIKDRLRQRKTMIESLKYGNLSDINAAIKDFLTQVDK